MRVYGYTRVSTEEQVAHGHSLEYQEEKIRLFCKLHNLDLAELITDAGVSAKNLRRPGLQHIIEGLTARDGGVAGLVIIKLDRLSRSVRDWSYLVDNFFGEHAKASLFSVEDSINTRTASGRLALNMIMAVAEWERESAGERTREVLRYKQSIGQVVSRPPRGFKIANKQLVLDAGSLGEQIAIKVFRLHKQGMSLRKIGARLVEAGYHPEHGGAWHASTIKRILTNHWWKYYMKNHDLPSPENMSQEDKP